MLVLIEFIYNFQTTFETRGISNRLMRPSSLEKPVLGPGHAQVLAQGLAFVFRAEDTAALQFWHNRVDEVV